MNGPIMVVLVVEPTHYGDPRWSATEWRNGLLGQWKIHKLLPFIPVIVEYIYVYISVYVMIVFCECIINSLWIPLNGTEYDKIYDFSYVMLSFNHIPMGCFTGTEAVYCDNNTMMNVNHGSDLDHPQSERFGTSWTNSGLDLGHYVMLSHWLWH